MNSWLLSRTLSEGVIMLEHEAQCRNSVYMDVSQICENRFKISADKIYKSLHQREKLGSTSLHNGAAVPHAKIEHLHVTTLVFVQLSQPIDYADKNDKVDLLLFVLAAEDCKNTHRQHVEQGAWLFADVKRREQLRQIFDKPEVILQIAQWEQDNLQNYKDKEQIITPDRLAYA